MFFVQSMLALFNLLGSETGTRLCANLSPVQINEETVDVIPKCKLHV